MVQGKITEADAPIFHQDATPSGLLVSPSLSSPVFCRMPFLILTHTHPFNGSLSGTTQVSWYQKGKTNLDFTEARDSERQWHQLGHMQVCTLLQTDNHTSTPPLSFLQAGCPSCRPTNSVKALKALSDTTLLIYLGFGQAPNNAGLHTQWLGWLLIKFYAYIVHICGLSVNVRV